MKTMLFNPYTGTPRHPGDIKSDPQGLLIVEPDAPMMAAAQTAQARADLTRLLARLENQWHRMGELWERCQGKGWPEKEDAEFRSLRDEKTPATRAAIVALITKGPAA